jgi:hypothetical protein
MHILDLEYFGSVDASIESFTNKSCLGEFVFIADSKGIILIEIAGIKYTERLGPKSLTIVEIAKGCVGEAKVSIQGSFGFDFFTPIERLTCPRGRGGISFTVPAENFIENQRAAKIFYS